MKLQPISEDFVVRSLQKLKLESYVDDKGQRCVEMPDKITHVLAADDILTLRTFWKRFVASEKRDRALELINHINSQAPTGKLIPIVNEQHQPAVEFRDHYILSPGVDGEQLNLILDAYFSIMNSIFDDFEDIAAVTGNGAE